MPKATWPRSSEARGLTGAWTLLELLTSCIIVRIAQQYSHPRGHRLIWPKSLSTPCRAPAHPRSPCSVFTQAGSPAPALCLSAPSEPLPVASAPQRLWQALSDGPRKWGRLLLARVAPATFISGPCPLVTGRLRVVFPKYPVSSSRAVRLATLYPHQGKQGGRMQVTTSGKLQNNVHQIEPFETANILSLWSTK